MLANNMEKEDTPLKALPRLPAHGNVRGPEAYK
jgi:hypothetical protein